MENLKSTWNQQWFIDTGKPNYDTHKQLGLLYDYSVEINAQKILELGVGGYGISTFAFLKAVEVTGGILTSVDINPLCGDFYKHPQWKFINADSLTISLEGQYDVIFLDTSHSVSATVAELKKYIPMVRKGGYFFVHDTDFDGVKIPLDEYINKYPDELEFLLSQDDQSQMTLFKKL